MMLLCSSGLHSPSMFTRACFIYPKTGNSEEQHYTSQLE
jgi:hypothetical protein